jgi:CBS domain-containing protein
MEGLATRISDFLTHFPPFSYLEREVLEAFSDHLKVKYFMKDEYVFKQGDEPEDCVFILNKGSVDIILNEGDDETLIDLVEEGDTFGVRAVLTGNPYLASAKVREDTLLYLLKKDVFVSYLEQYPRMSLFFAAGFASGNPVVHGEADKRKEARNSLLFKENKNLFREDDLLILGSGSEIMCGFIYNTIQEVAQAMAESRVGSMVIIDENKLPVGIVTDTDFTRKVVSQDIPYRYKITDIMSRPVVTVESSITVATAILTMMRNKIRHLVVTEDGSPQSQVVGVISERDILLMQGNNPAVLVKRIMKSSNLDELRGIRDRAGELVQRYLEQEVSIPFVADMMTEINDSLIHRAIEISMAKLEAEGVENPNLRFVWMSLGSEGRGEQLLRTDQDNALLYDDPPKGKEEIAENYFLRLGEEVNSMLEHFGYEKCPADIMARNPKWNQSLWGWKQHFANWLHVPDPQAVMHSTIFFDYRCGYGDQGLLDKLTEFLYDEIHKARRFMHFMAKNALENPPPLSFFRNFIVARSGEHKDKFDIKQRAMMPLADAARLLSMHYQFSGVNNTFERYEHLAEVDAPNKSVYEEAAMTYELLMRYRALNGFANNDSGRYISPEKLNKIERKTLKYSFRTIDAVQRVLKSKFDLNIFS